METSAKLITTQYTSGVIKFFIVLLSVINQPCYKSLQQINLFFKKFSAGLVVNLRKVIDKIMLLIKYKFSLIHIIVWLKQNFINFIQC